MLIRSFPEKVKFICGFIYKNEDTYKRIRLIMQKSFGPIDHETSKVPFGFTAYYNKEMGAPLYRQFISFHKLINPESFVKIKLYCINLEKKTSKNRKRNINIDPGYINMAKLVLFTTKDFSHRLYMGKGIYAEVTLIYTKGKFKDLEWTYPDYKTSRYKKFFIDTRDNYKKQIQRGL